MMKTVEKSTSKPCNNPFLGFVAFAKIVASKVNNGLSVSCYLSSTFDYPCQHLATPTTLKRTLWCIKSALTYRRLDNDGHEIADWKQNPKLGHWYINTSKQIGEY
jgi:hypothetical protein